jgi:deferrochelatase/peroxidase EfeB
VTPATTTGDAVDLQNVQGLVHEFYPCECSRYLLFKFTGGDGRGFLRDLLPLVTVAGADTAPGAKLLNVGLTCEGLAALGVDDAVLKEFPLDFSSGPDPIVLGDFGDSAPQHWWNGRFVTKELHALVQLTGHTDVDIGSLTVTVRAFAAARSVSELVATKDGAPIDGRHLGKGRLHFGYRDGLSQPDVDWTHVQADPGKENFRQFVLGYSNSTFSSSPKLSASRPITSKAATDLARDGCYAVFKWIYQDVARFNQFLETEGPRLAPTLTPADAQELLAAKLMGRWRDGTPLVLSPDAPSASLAASNDFKYAAADPNGVRCPFAAHVRVVNPRDQELSPSEPPLVPRVIRRGTPFGPPLEGTVDDGQLRGLVGVFLCASIGAQVYTLTSWMKRTDFSPKFSDPMGQDPLANRQTPGASATFDIPSAAGQTATVTLADFTRTLGTALFFVPGVSGLRTLSS